MKIWGFVEIVRSEIHGYFAIDHSRIEIRRRSHKIASCIGCLVLDDNTMTRFVENRLRAKRMV